MGEVFSIQWRDVDEDDGDMGSDASEEEDEVAHVLAAADALGMTLKDTKAEFDGIADALKELDMDNYDDEDDGF
ncbi:unnamed protein product [Cuscuta campestris]|uniref:Uncharacterized protein n=1 Tax=Cuscuta campestris TaxID=132261 RepID=A0A484N6J1_9ASTE|nr:unnamed protein product [Cuscuta campestris]